MRKWMNWETSFRSLSDSMSAFLKSSGIQYERSGCFGGYHFEVNVNDAEVKAINDWIDQNTITNK